MRVLLVLCLLAGFARADSSFDAADLQTTTGYRKGRPIKLTLAPADWTYLDVRAAADYRAMQEAARRDGVELYLRSGFRTHDRQIMLYAAWKAGWGNRAARPGFSLHQSGRALDLYVGDERTRAWLQQHARSYGFRRTVGDEPWHFEHGKRLAPRKKPLHARK